MSYSMGRRGFSAREILDIIRVSVGISNMHYPLSFFFLSFSLFFLSFSLFFLSFFFLLFLLFRASLGVYGGSQARGPIGATAAGHSHSHSHARSKPWLRCTPQLMATLDP